MNVDNLDFEELMKDLMVRPIWYDHRAIKQEYLNLIGSTYNEKEIIIILMQSLLQQNMNHYVCCGVEDIQRICSVITLDENFMKKYLERLCLKAVELREEISQEMLDEYTVEYK